MNEIEARNLLRRIAAHARTMRTLLDAALGEASPKQAADAGMPPSTYVHIRSVDATVAVWEWNGLDASSLVGRG